MNTNVKVMGLTRLDIKLKSTVPEVDALIAKPSDVEMALADFFATWTAQGP